jgi:hypothetical protein
MIKKIHIKSEEKNNKMLKDGKKKEKKTKKTRVNFVN